MDKVIERVSENKDPFTGRDIDPTKDPGYIPVMVDYNGFNMPVNPKWIKFKV